MAAIKTDSCCTIRNRFVETSMRKVLLLTSSMYYACIWFLKVLFYWQTLILFIIYYTLSGTLFTGTKSTSIGDLMLPDRKSIVANIIHVCDLSIIFQFPNVFSSSIFLHLCYRYRLAMDESKSELNVRCCAEYNAKQVLIKIKTLIQVVNKSN
jgi:hypothetical protein